MITPGHILIYFELNEPFSIQVMLAETREAGVDVISLLLTEQI